MRIKRVAILSLALLLSLALAVPGALAASKDKAGARVLEALDTLNMAMKQDDKSVPRDLLKKAKAVAIFPGMIKAGFIIGGEGGTGVICMRHKDGSYSPPAFFTMAGASFGLQIGAASTDLLLVVMKQRGLDGILKNQVKFGAGVSAAVGPVGRTASAGLTAAAKDADVLSYSWSKGLFAGIALDGMGMEYDADTSKNYYGKALGVRDILEKGKAVPPESAKKLMSALAKYSK
jgi:lipid-binding SYLF domain-containing protein